MCPPDDPVSPLKLAAVVADASAPSVWAAPVITRDTTEQELAAYLAEISKHPALPPVPLPVEPTLLPSMAASKRLTACQRFISSFEYNYTGESYVQLQKDRGMSRLVSLAKEIIAKALPIQCIEAVFLAVYLTRDMKDVRLCAYCLLFPHALSRNRGSRLLPSWRGSRFRSSPRSVGTSTATSCSQFDTKCVR